MSCVDDLVIRLMSVEDFEAVGELARRLDAIHVGSLPWLFREAPGGLRGRAYFEGILGDARAVVYVAVRGGVVGFVHARLVDAPDFPIFLPQTRAVVEAIFVAPERRGEGIAGALMDSATSWAAGLGATGVDLVVYEFNKAAEGAFAAMGFTTLHRKMTKPLV